MSRIRQSISWWCFENLLSPDQLLQAAREIGYAAVELVPLEAWQRAKDAGFAIASTRGHTQLERGLNRREHLPEIEREVRDNLEWAVKWDVPVVICFSGNRAGLDDDTGAKITAENLHYLASFAESAGVTLAMELLNSKVDHPDYQCDHTEWGVKVCEMVGSPQVKLLYDIYHMQVMEGDIIRTIQTHHAHFVHYHTAGNPGRAELDESQELNYRAITQAIVETGYRGFIGQEFVPKGDPIRALKAAFEICSKIPRHLSSTLIEKVV